MRYAGARRRVPGIWLAVLFLGTLVLGSLALLYHTGQGVYPEHWSWSLAGNGSSRGEKVELAKAAEAIEASTLPHVPEGNANSNTTHPEAPATFDELISAPALDTWRTPVVSPHPGGTSLLLLHVFSTISPESRVRRALIRRLGLLRHVHERYRHLVEINFVLGYPDPEKMAVVAYGDAAAEFHGDGDDDVPGEPNRPFDGRAAMREEAEIEREMQEHGDIVRLKGLLHGENVDHGKSWEWIRWVGRHSPRSAQWVFKCEDDTLPNLPALLSLLITLDPAQPTYMGTSSGTKAGVPHYFQGLLYGITWNVTIAAADVPKGVIQEEWHEAARIGSLMWSLPASSDCPVNLDSGACDAHTPPPSGALAVPPSPDPRTGLIRVDLLARLGEYQMPGIAEVDRAIAWRGLTTAEKYLQAWRDIDAFNLKRYGSGGWIPPARLSFLAAPEPGTDTEGEEGPGTRPGKMKQVADKVSGGRIAEYGGRRPP